MNPSYPFDPPATFVADELNLAHHPLSSASSSSSSSHTLSGSDQDFSRPSSQQIQFTQHRPEDDRPVSHQGLDDDCQLLPSDSHERDMTRSDPFQNKEDRSEDQEDHDDYSSHKWLPSKIRIIRKMMGSNQASGNRVATNSAHKFADEKRFQLPPPVESNAISKGSSYSNNDNTIRVCSDCNTTKTPLWRSGPRGPKSLCNACGIRQRKARRALAAAAAEANGTILPPATPSIKIKVKTKTKKPRIGGNSGQQFKKGWKQNKSPPNSSPTKKINNLCYEDFTSRILSKHYSTYQRVFPQDEREAAILLMALSYGLVHG